MHIYNTFLVFLESLSSRNSKALLVLPRGLLMLGESPQTAWFTSLPPGSLIQTGSSLSSCSLWGKGTHNLYDNPSNNEIPLLSFKHICSSLFKRDFNSLITIYTLKAVLKSPSQHAFLNLNPTSHFPQVFWTMDLISLFSLGGVGARGVGDGCLRARRLGSDGHQFECQLQYFLAVIWGKLLGLFKLWFFHL